MRRCFSEITFLVLVTVFFGAGSAIADVYNILAIRVEFPFEDPDHETTSGRGLFDLRDYHSDSSLREEYYNPWDIPPRDKIYFGNHLTALHNYWHTVSEGKISIDHKILPHENQRAYKMANTFYKYGNGRTREQTYQKLADLIKEAVLKCKSEESAGIDFSQYDTIMIIRAGIGRETSGKINDMPSAYLSRKDIRKYLGRPLVIDTREIEHCIIVPEAVAFNGAGGLNGIMALMFGYRLGLPSLSNNRDGLPAAGGWSLMDTGAMAWGNYTRGFVPTHPCAWSKIELEFFEPVTVTTDTVITIAATHIYSSPFPEAVKIPVSSSEYFLLENRFSTTNRDSSFADFFYSGPENTGVWMKPNTPENYDAYIPGSGILIWRVNSDIIENNRAEHSVNNDPFRRGLDLLEADGRQDIGAWFSFGDPRAEYSEGWSGDTFKLGGNSVLSPTTNPSSESMWGGNTGITIEVLSVPGDTMTVSIKFETTIREYSHSVPDPVMLTTFNSDPLKDDNLIISGGGTAGILRDDFSVFETHNSSWHPPMIVSGGKTGIFIGNGNSVRKVFSDNSESTFSLDPNMRAEGASCSDNGRILFTTRFYQNGIPQYSYLNLIEGSTITTAIAALPDSSLPSSIAMYEDFAAVRTSGGKLYLCSLQTGEVIGVNIPVIAHGPVITDINRNGSPEVIVTGGAHFWIVYLDGSYKRVDMPHESVGSPAIADIESDGYPEIVFSTSKGIVAYKSDGVLLEGFPINLPPGDPDETVISPPLIADIDNNSSPDIIVVTSNSRIFAYDRSGSMLSGFPVVIRNTPGTPPALINSTNRTGLAYLSDEKVHVHYFENRQSDTVYWPMSGGGPGLISALHPAKITSPVKTTCDFNAYIYPNPVTGPRSTLRINPSGITHCDITIYTADGRRVYERRIPQSDIIPGIANEFPLNLETLSSGLYFVSISTAQRNLRFKIGVLR